MFGKRLHLTGIALVLVLLLTACFSSEPEVEEVQLRVYDPARIPYEMTYKSFDYEEPQLSVEHLMTWQGEQHSDGINFEEMLEAPDAPDILKLDYLAYYELMDKGLLMPLDPYLAGSELSENETLNSLINSFRSGADQELYGIMTGFSSHALIYNKTLFDRVNLPYPTDETTWEEVFQSARQLTQNDLDERIYGLQLQWGNSWLPSISEWLLLYAPPLGMKLFEDGEMTINTEQWKELWETNAALAAEGVFPGTGHMNVEAVEQPLNLFLVGKLAMSFVTPSDVNNINNLDQHANLFPDYEPIDWDLAPLPKHAEHAHVNGGLLPQNFFAINAKSSHAQEAWELIEFVLLEEMEHGEQSEIDRAIFYPTSFVTHPQYIPFFNSYREFVREILFESDRLIFSMLKNDISVEEAFMEWERLSERILPKESNY